MRKPIDRQKLVQVTVIYAFALVAAAACSQGISKFAKPAPPEVKGTLVDENSSEKSKDTPELRFSLPKTAEASR